MIKVLLIDAEALARQLLRDYLSEESDVYIAGECSDGFEALKAIKTEKPDLLFLDVQMPRINGFELLELLDEPIPVIFITAYDEYALKAFEAAALDYLLKPYPRERLQKALEKFRLGSIDKTGTDQVQKWIANSREPESLDRIVVKHAQGIKIIPVQEITFLEAFDDYVKIHTESGKFLKKHTLQHFEEKLPQSGFVRVHRSFILNLEYLTRIEPSSKDQHQAILKTSERIPLSRRGYARLREVLGI